MKLRPIGLASCVPWAEPARMSPNAAVRHSCIQNGDPAILEPSAEARLHTPVSRAEFVTASGPTCNHRLAWPGRSKPQVDRLSVLTVQVLAYKNAQNRRDRDERNHAPDVGRLRDRRHCGQPRGVGKAPQRDPASRWKKQGGMQ